MNHQTSRRDFIRKSALATVGLSAAGLDRAGLSADGMNRAGLSLDAVENNLEVSDAASLLFDREHIKYRGEHAAGRWEDNALHILFEDHDWPIFTVEFPKVNMINVEGLELDIENTGEHAATIFGYGGEENPYCWSSGLLQLAPGEREKLRVMVFHQKPPEAEKAFPKMMGLPGRSAHMDVPDIYKSATLDCLRIELEGEGCPVQIVLRSIQKFGLCSPPTGEAAKDIYPVMDRFGQYRHGEWINKIRRMGDLVKQNEKEKREMTAYPCPPDRNKYGGWTGGPRHEATGHFYVKMIDGRWWFVDPEGCLYWAFGPTYVRSSCRATLKGYEYLYEEPVEDGDYYRANILRRYGGDNWKEAFHERTHARIRHWGMNTFGIASDRDLCLTSLTPYSMGINSLRYAAGNGLGLLDAAWKQRLEESAARVCEQTADDPFCIGYFMDNEIHDKPDFERWNYYYATCRDVMKKYAPNKLYLGSRQDWHRFPRGGNPVRVDFSDGPDVHDYTTTYKGYEATLRAYAAHADVLSFNQYRYTYYHLRMPDYANKPILISETTVGAMDRGMIHPSLRPTQCQDERALACRHMLDSALKNPWIAGVHWFMYMDQPCTGWSGNAENFQMGLVDICDTPYPELRESIMEVGYSMYERRYAGVPPAF